MTGSDKKRFIFILICILVVFTFIGWTSNELPATQRVIEIRFATIAPDGTPWSDQAMALKERIERESDGRIRFVPYLGGQLGGEIETLRSMQRGRIQAWGGSVGAITSIVPELQLLEFPYLFLDDDEVDYILDEILFEPFSELMSKRNLILHSWNENGWRHFGSKRRPILTPGDLRGFKVRSQESSLHLDMWRAWGAQPVPISTTEVMSALQTGLVDGFDQSTLYASATGWYQAIDHFVLSGHMYQAAAIIFSKSFWDTLPPDLQEIILGNPKAEAETGRTGVRAIEPELHELLEVEGVTVHRLNEEQRREFAKAMGPLHNKFRDEVGIDLFDRMQTALTEYREQRAER